MSQKSNMYLLIAVALILSGCSVKQSVTPYNSVSPFELCIIEDPAVRAGFLVEYKRNLELMDIRIKMLPPGSPLTSCPVVSTYTGRWSWDLTIYMTFAEIRVYEDGRLAGSALYDSTGGGARLDKWKDAEKKISELVTQLFAR